MECTVLYNCIQVSRKFYLVSVTKSMSSWKAQNVLFVMHTVITYSSSWLQTNPLFGAYWFGVWVCEYVSKNVLNIVCQFVCSSVDLSVTILTEKPLLYFCSSPIMMNEGKRHIKIFSSIWASVVTDSRWGNLKYSRCVFFRSHMFMNSILMNMNDCCFAACHHWWHPYLPVWSFSTCPQEAQLGQHTLSVGMFSVWICVVQN